MNTSARRAALHGPQSRPNTGALRLRTAFVLSGGASLGALQVGMLEALYDRRTTPHFLVGTSVGALNAAFVASRPQSSQTARELGRCTDRLSSPPPMRLGDGASVECLDGDAKLWRSAIGRSHVLLANRPNGAILKPKPRLRACAVTHSQRPRPTLTP